MTNYCFMCDKEVETKIISRKEKFDVFDEIIEVDVQALICTECGRDLFSSKTIYQIMPKYGEPSEEEIKARGEKAEAIREKSV